MEATKTREISEINWPAKTFLIRRETRNISDLPTFFGESYGMIYKALGELHNISEEPPYAFYYMIDETNKTTDLAAAVEVKGNIPEVPGLQKIELPASRLITTTHYGSYDDMYPAYNAMEQYLTDHHLKKELSIEQYFSDPEVEKDPSKWKTVIYFLVSEKQT